VHAVRVRDQTASRRRRGEIRTWAKEHGIEVSERGRIPAAVLEQYRAATKAPLNRQASNTQRQSKHDRVVAPSA